MTRRLAVLLFALSFPVPAFAEEAAVAYPTGFRQWAHVKSMLIHSDKHPLFATFGGIHHIYANPDAMKALIKGGTFPDGSVLVFDLLEAKEENGAWVEGSRKLVGVMEKNRTRFKATGGWGFESFKGDSRSERLARDANEECFGCHRQQRSNDFVFSSYRP